MTNWTGLSLTNPEPSILDAIAHAAPPKRRVRILQDRDSSDPRTDFDLMCEIAGDFSWRNRSKREHLINLIAVTKGYEAACTILSVASVDGNYDEPNLWDDDIRDDWLERLAETELKVHQFESQSYTYVAHTTPEMCAKIGVDWDRAQVVMEAECSTFRQWADGDVYGFVVEEWTGACACEDCEAGEWVETDSCWGFYGSDPFTNGMSEHVDEELHDELRRAEPEY